MGLLLLAFRALDSGSPTLGTVSREGDPCFLFFPTGFGLVIIMVSTTGCLPDSRGSYESTTNTNKGKRKANRSDHQAKKFEVWLKDLA